jgi:murein L,D-transpeptidase YafK
MQRRGALSLGIAGLALAATGVWAHAPDPHPLPPHAQVSRLVVDIDDRTMQAFAPDGARLKTYRVAVGQRAHEGDKARAGDDRTPEGVYTLTPQPRSVAHMAIRTGYPTPAQSVAARRDGRDPGGDIMVHGLEPWYAWAGRLHTIFDYTHGCVAVTNPEIEELHAAVGRYNTPQRTAQIELRR